MDKEHHLTDFVSQIQLDSIGYKEVNLKKVLNNMIQDDKILLIKLAIENAEKGISKLTQEVINSIGGYTSPCIRHLLNNLGSISTDFFEIGCHRGATFCATIYENYNLRSVVACDDFSEFNIDNPQLDLLNNIVKYSPINNPQIISYDAFKIKELEYKPDLYFYDGNHSVDSHKKALTHFYDMLPNEFIYLVDDANWDEVREGTYDGIRETGLDILFQKALPSPEWHNGFLIFILRKGI